MGEYIALSALWSSIIVFLACAKHKSAGSSCLYLIAGYLVVKFAWLVGIPIWSEVLLARLERSDVYAICTALVSWAVSELAEAIRARKLG